jgi:hypothetical protein
VLLITKVTILAAIPSVLAYHFGIDDPAPWVGLAIICLGFLYVRYFGVPSAGRLPGGKKSQSSSS